MVLNLEFYRALLFQHIEVVIKLKPEGRLLRIVAIDQEPAHSFMKLENTTAKYACKNAQYVHDDEQYYDKYRVHRVSFLKN